MIPVAISSDAAGNLFIGGNYLSPADSAYIGSMSYVFPSPNTFMPSFTYTSVNQTRGFVIKLDAAGGFVWGTYLGGENISGVDYLACTSTGEVYVAGGTNSLTNIATPGTSYQNYIGDTVGTGNFETYLTKLDANGHRIWGTYTNGIRGKGGLVVNSQDEFYLGGVTNRTTGISTPGVHQENNEGGTDYCLTKWSPNGQKI